jgi:hypothetical protein
MRVSTLILTLPFVACLSSAPAQAQHSIDPCPIKSKTRACEFPIVGKPGDECPSGRKTLVCAGEPIAAELECYSSNNAVICDGYPLEVVTVGKLQYTWQVRVAGVNQTYYGPSIYVPCQATNPVSVRLSVQNGSYIASAFQGLRCGDAPN